MTIDRTEFRFAIEDAVCRFSAATPGASLRDPDIVRRLSCEVRAAVLQVFCPTCMGRSRRTVNLVCQTCGRDYGPPSESP